MPERQSGDYAYPRNAHQLARRLVRLGLLPNSLIQRVLLQLDQLVDGQQSFHDRPQDVLLLEQAEHMRAKPRSDSAREQQPDLLEQAAHLVLEVAADADQSRPGNVVVNEPGLALADVANDYSLLHLSVPILGAAAMQIVAGANIETAHITGFPDTAGGAMVSDTQTISAIPEIDNVYRVSSEGGLLSPGISGAPLWMTDASGQPVVMGIMSAEDSAGDYAVQFNPAVADQINAWVAADDYVPPPVAAAPRPLQSPSCNQCRWSWTRRGPKHPRQIPHLLQRRQSPPCRP